MKSAAMVRAELKTIRTVEVDAFTLLLWQCH